MIGLKIKQIMEFVGEPLVAAIIAFLVSLFTTMRVLSVFIKTTCRDGWESPSIGLRGACSWHGGVTDSGIGAIATIISLLIAILVAVRRDIVTERRAKKEQLLSDNALKLEAANRGIACPKCGFAMRLRKSHKAPNRGRHFMSCTRYPKCIEDRPLTAKEKRTYDIRR